MSHDPKKYAPVLTLEEFARLRDDPSIDMGVVVATSGGYDPIHPGHVTCIVESTEHGDTLVVIVNGDDFLKNKKGKPFQDIDHQVAQMSRRIDPPSNLFLVDGVLAKDDHGDHANQHQRYRHHRTR